MTSVDVTSRLKKPPMFDATMSASARYVARRAVRHALLLDEENARMSAHQLRILARA